MDTGIDPTTEAKETYYRGKRDLLHRQKRPTTSHVRGPDMRRPPCCQVNSESPVRKYTYNVFSYRMCSLTECVAHHVVMRMHSQSPRDEAVVLILNPKP
jgi:hypothetical protein